MKGKILARFGSHISTDDIVSAKYVISHAPKEVAKICMRDVDPDFSTKMAIGGFVLGAKNFGCGSSRETASIAMKAAGAHAIIAEEFARIFYRNCFNIGLPCIECPGISSATDIGDELDIDIVEGWVYNLSKVTKHKCIATPKFLIEQLNAGGLIPILRQKFQRYDI